jgi:hypothetical protein
VNEILVTMARSIGRRRLLARSLTLAFGALAGAAVGGIPMAEAGTCSGPYGTGSCGCACNGAGCASGCSVSCNGVYGFCAGGGSICWQSGDHTCCDCQCVSYGYWFYCYCHS